MSNKKKKPKVEIINRKAGFEYAFIQEYEAGIMLTGTEIKSIRDGNVNLSDAYCMFDQQGALWVRNMFIAEYDHGTDNNHLPRRNRQLLLRKPEMKKLSRGVMEKGSSIIPFKMYINERGFAKLLIELARGKKSFDKRETIKQRDDKRELDRLQKKYNVR